MAVSVSKIGACEGCCLAFYTLVMGIKLTVLVANGQGSARQNSAGLLPAFCPHMPFGR